MTWPATTWRHKILLWVAPLLLLAQVALAFHQLDHKIAPDAVASAHECVLCNVSAGAAPPPEPFAILPPDLGVQQRAPFIVQVADKTPGAWHFHSRAPPFSAAV